MSVEAIAWASKQRTGSPGAKLVLIALANYANDSGQLKSVHGIDILETL